MKDIIIFIIASLHLTLQIASGTYLWEMNDTDSGRGSPCLINDYGADDGGQRKKFKSIFRQLATLCESVGSWVGGEQYQDGTRRESQIYST